MMHDAQKKAQHSSAEGEQHDWEDTQKVLRLPQAFSEEVTEFPARD